MLDGIGSSLFQWITNNGIAVVFAVILLGFVYRILFTSIDKIVASIQEMGQDHKEAITELSGAIGTLNTTTVQGNEALKLVLLFISQNMQQVVAHRQETEGKDAPVNVPGPPIIAPEGTIIPHGGSESTNIQNPQDRTPT